MSAISAIVKFIKETLMSLHDTDKNSPTRNKPSLNAPDLDKSPMAHGTTQAQNSIDTPQADGLKIKERQIIAVQDGFNKAAFGFYGTANKFGLKVAEDGTDVLTATDDQLIFNSEQNVFKVADTLRGDISYSFPTHSGSGQTIDTSSTLELSHSLGFRPAILVFSEYTIFGNVITSPIGDGALIGGAVGGGMTIGGGTGFAHAITKVSIWIDEQNVKLAIERWGNLGNGAYGSTLPTEVNTISFKVYILQETAS